MGVERKKKSNGKFVEKRDKKDREREREISKKRV